jgi:peptidoglycan hydrolase CwlO-like protein
MADGPANLWAALDKAREWWLPMAGAAPAAIVAWLAGRRKADAEAGKVAAEADKTSAEAEAIASNATIKAFQALIDGYEKRIADLTAEVHSLRDEIKSLRQVLDQRTREEAERARRGGAS